MKKLSIILFALVFLCKAADAMGLEIAAGTWNQSVQGDVSYKSEDRLDFENNLGYGDQFNISGRLKVDFPTFIPNIYVMATPMSFDAEGTYPEDFTFGDTRFEGDTAFYSEMVLNHYDIALFYGVPLLSHVSFDIINVELGINVRIVDLEATVRQQSESLEESVRHTLTIPMFYLATQIQPMEKLTIEAEMRGITYDDNHLVSVIGRLKYSPLSPIFVAGGYRYDNIVFKEKDIDADMEIIGPFFEAGFQF